MKLDATKKLVIDEAVQHAIKNAGTLTNRYTAEKSLLLARAISELGVSGEVERQLTEYQTTLGVDAEG